jgi:hypothetical protein
LLTDRAYSLWHTIRAPLTGAAVKILTVSFKLSAARSSGRLSEARLPCAKSQPGRVNQALQISYKTFKGQGFPKAFFGFVNPVSLSAVASCEGGWCQVSSLRIKLWLAGWGLEKTKGSMVLPWTLGFGDCYLLPTFRVHHRNLPHFSSVLPGPLDRVKDR